MDIKLLRALIKRDFIYGTSKTYLRYIFLIFILVLINIGYINIGEDFKSRSNVIDLYFNLFSGIGYDRPITRVPLVWYIINCYVLFITGGYINEDFENNAIYVMTRCKNRRIFFISKLIWIIINVLVYYALVFGITYVFGKMFLTDEFRWSFEATHFIVPKFTRSIEPWNFVLYTFLLYITSSMAIAIFQGILSLIIKPIYSYLIVISLIFISILGFSSLFPGQHSMVLRHNIFKNMYNLSILESMIYNLSIIFLSIVIGQRCLLNKDII